MRTPSSRFLAVPALLASSLGGLGPAAADGLDEGQARSKIEAAGYADVAAVHEGNLGEWMAQATRDGHHVMVVVHADGSVALRQDMQVPPAKNVADEPVVQSVKP